MSGRKDRVNLSLIVFFVVCLGLLMLDSCVSRVKIHEYGSVSHPRVVLSPYDSLKQLYDSMVSQYNASRVVIDQEQTHAAQLDSQVKKKEHEIVAVKNKIEKIESQKIEKVETSNKELREELKKVEKVNTALKELGSVLHASHIRIYAMHTNRSGSKEKAVHKGRKMNLLRMFFDLDENYVAEEGMKTLYIIITAPDGKLIRKDQDSTGSFTAFNGTQLQYSVSKQVLLRRNEPIKDIQISCPVNSDHESGMYHVSIYNAGYRIGNDVIKLM